MRLFAVQAAFEQGISLDKVHELTRIDRWFLSKMRRVARLRAAMEGMGDCSMLNLPSLRKIKQAGFSDGQIAHYTHCLEPRVRRHRLSLGLKPVVKQIDTLGAEFPAMTRAGKGLRHWPTSNRSYPGRFPLVSADFSTSDPLSERSRT